MSAKTLAAGVQRLLAVPGYSGRTNDVIYGKCKATKAEYNVVFFGGDVQDYPENMLAHRDNHRYVKWNLEATAAILADSFPQSDIMVIKPSRMYLQTFSCYDNFVESNQTGVPLHTAQWGAHKHVLELLLNVGKTVKNCHSQSKDAEISSKVDTAETCKDCKDLPDRGPLVLIGFSKGCVVLNQLAHEIHHGADQTEMKEFISRVKSMYWLDGGHAGGSHVWITESAILKSLASTGIQICVHVTPYQVEDDQRPWIRREEKIFTETLRKMKAPITRTQHSKDEAPSIELHFKILEQFNCN